MIIEKSEALKNFPQTIKIIITATNMYESDYIMSCCTPIPSVENTPKKIYIGGTLWDEFTSEYYNDNNDDVRLLFQQYTDSAIENIYHTSTAI